MSTPADRLQNWAGNLAYGAIRRHRPQSVEEVQELVAGARRVKALGSRHSFTPLADTPGELISLERLEIGVTVDPQARTARVGGGIRYGELARELHRAGWALANLASLPHISVAGAVATATHGSGDGNPSLASGVIALELVTASGELVRLSRGALDFDGVVVSLGALGVVTALTLELVPAFEVEQRVYEGLPLARLERHFDAVLGAAYSVSLFTDWREAAFHQVWLKRRLGDPEAGGLEALGATPAAESRHPIRGYPAINTTPQLGAPGPWFERLPHFRLEHTPSAGEELQSEYLVPRDHALEALHAVYALREQVRPLLQVCEVRSVASDAFWLSPFDRQPCLGLHFTWRKDPLGVVELLPVLEARLAPLGARPHWGKLFTLPPEAVRPLYERLPDFQRLAGRFDPQGKFRNAFLERYVLLG